MSDTATLRTRAEAFVAREIETHVPRLWQARARLYLPLLVDRLVAFVEAVTGQETAP